MAHQLFHLPRPTAISNNLTLVAGAKVGFFLTGTSTPTNSYQDSALTTPHTNPVIADAAGRLPAIYLNPGVIYRITFTSGDDVEIYPAIDPANDQIPPTYTRTPAESAALVTPVDFSYVPGDIRRYGTNTTPGTTVMTAAVAATFAISATHRAVFQSQTYLTALQTPPAGADIYLPPGCILKDNGALGASERFLNITSDNIRIVGYGAKVQMTRADYTTGEQRHGVYIFGAQNITIEGLESSSCGGDGFYIGGAAGDPATNVRLIGCKADDNRRQGCSVVSARHLRLVDFHGTNTNGTAPCAGIDVEPNAATDILEDIKIIRPRCVGNDGPGIEVFLSAWNAISNYADVEIIEPYTANNGAVSQSGRLRAGVDINRIGSTTPCRGRIVISDLKSVDEQIAGIHIYDWDENGPEVVIIRPVVVNPNQANGNVSVTHGGIILHNSTTYTSAPGNLRISDALVRDDDGLLNANTLNPYRISGAWGNVVLANPKYAYAGGNPWGTTNTIRDVRITSDRPISAAISGDLTITDGRYIGRTISNGGASGTTTKTLIAAAANVIGWRMRFEVTAAFELRIDPSGTNTIRGGTAGQYLVSSTIGDNVEVECDSATSWKIVSRYGTWTFV